MGKCYSDSLFQNCMRANQFSIIPRNLCILYFLLYHVGTVGLSFKKIGFKKGMMIGFWAMALGAFILCQGHSGDISIWFVVLLGLANSLVWAGMWPLSLEGLGRFIKPGASVMIMGLCGNAILPLFYRWPLICIMPLCILGIIPLLSVPCILCFLRPQNKKMDLLNWC